MIKKKKHVRMYVDPDFKKFIRKAAIDEDKNIIDFTRVLAKDKKKFKGLFDEIGY